MEYANHLIKGQLKKIIKHTKNAKQKLYVFNQAVDYFYKKKIYYYNSTFLRRGQNNLFILLVSFYVIKIFRWMGKGSGMQFYDIHLYI